jgi:malonyl-CoA decarboxylase
MAHSLLKKIARAVVPPPDMDARAQRHSAKVVGAWSELLTGRGEVSGAALAREALGAWQRLAPEYRAAFFDQLAASFTPDTEILRAASSAWLATPTPENLIALQQASASPRQELFRRINQAPGGTAMLVALRAELLAGLAERPRWRVIDADLTHLFNSWFNRGFLSLERIDWHTPAIVLEKLIEYEAVHEISGWRDLRRRLQNDRRCFGFFHPALPDEPLIFIEVALTRGIASAIGPLLALDAPVSDPEKADTAMFYSITNCQPGLRGVSFGNLLIKQVAQKLGEEFPRIKTFSTLSPIPGFRAWLNRQPGMQPLMEGLRRADWHTDHTAAEALATELLPLCAYYLTSAMKDNEPLDAVARFHLGNGARAERLNWLADLSPRGLERSAGMMVNYVYHLDDIEANHEAYVMEHRVASTHELRRLARGCAPAAAARKV